MMNKLRRRRWLCMVVFVLLVVWVCLISNSVMVRTVDTDLQRSVARLGGDVEKTSKKTVKPGCNCVSISLQANKETVNISSLIRFPPVLFNENIDNFTFDNGHLFQCTQPNGPGPDGIEDLMCIPRPHYLPGYKNPCFYDKYQLFYCMPYYIILGFDKCGTTDLSYRLQLHPSVLKSIAYLYKEIYYWSWRRFGLFVKTSMRVMKFREYYSSFNNASDIIEPLAGQANQPIVGDGGPTDGWDFRGWQMDPQNAGLSEPRVLAPHHIRHLLKEPRFIVLMREPAERLYSDYLFLRYGDSPEKFDRDARTSIDMMNECLKVNTTRQCFYSRQYFQKTPARLHIGCYSVFLREWFSVFHRKHFFFLRSEDYKKDIRGNLQAVFAFLGIDSLPDTLLDTISDQEKRLQTTQKKKAGPMLPETKKMLQDFYQPCNKDLAQLLGDDKYLWNNT
ncbi:unnamed protein product [Candidula unifasciata]|uniref:Sulfotransferase domain-containing protein n=1 Tax=Candidula unifasciata TaxID=100452 RepID=A0A8S3ZJF6_9EUPU|nr:unnamed protein product [Candidula unifasciata]